MVLQALEGLSDREAIGRLRRDIAWKAAAGLGLTDRGFHPTVLTLWRARLRRSEAPERIFDAVRKVVDQSGVLSGRVRRVLDSTVLDDAVVTQDTVTMITAQIRRCRRLISQARGVVVSHDYDQGGKPSCDWADSDSRSGLIHSLVSDGLAVLDAVADTDLDKRQSEAVGLLGVVVGQDVEPDPQREGKWRIARRVASGSDDFGGRSEGSSRSQNFFAASGRLQSAHSRSDTGIVTACEITGATTADGPAGVELLGGEPSDTEVIADSAYGSGEVRAKLRAAGHRAIIKPIGQRRNPRLGPDQFTRDDFVIDHDQNRVTCPAGNTATIGTKGQVRFGVVCTECPHRQRCTTSKRGRYLTIHPHDRLLTKAQHQWKQPKTVGYNRHRPSVERIIAWVVANGNRKLRYRGIKPNRQQLHTRIAAINLRRLINLGLHHTPTGWATNPT